MEEELWLAGMSKVHAKIWADKYDELGRIADSRKVMIEGLEAENTKLRLALRWYRQETKALKTYSRLTNDFRLCALTLLLDGGKFADKALMDD